MSLKIAVGIPVFNDESFIEQSVNNCLDVGYDYVVYLDDGSTDSTYEKLLYYTKNYDNILVLRNKDNSVSSNGTNRWKTVSLECAKFNPDWITVRAADECLSFPAFNRGQNLFRKNLEYIDSKGFNMVVFPYIHLWRSPFWYRVDGYWGGCRDGGSICAWKNHTGWEFNDKSGLHLGSHRPNRLKVESLITHINDSPTFDPLSDKPIVVLHYGMSSTKHLSDKLDYQISTSLQLKNRAVGMPDFVPSPRFWNRYNGYKVADERNIILEKVKQLWYEDELPKEEKPAIIPLVSVIAKYDLKVAEEYAELYGR